MFTLKKKKTIHVQCVNEFIKKSNKIHITHHKNKINSGNRSLKRGKSGEQLC